MRVQLVDPPAYTPPYDHSLAAALARAGADVELVTSRFQYGPPPALGSGYRVSERFYRRSDALGGPGRLKRAAKLLEHAPGMLAYRRHAREADIVHYEWLTLEPIDPWLLPPTRPRVFTAHNVVAHDAPRGYERARRRLLRAMDAVVVHSEFGAAQMRERLGVPPERVRVIHHGAFDYLTRLRQERPLPSELGGAEGPVALFFGLLRPYKGVDVLLEAWRAVTGAELWIAGMPRMPLEPLRRAAARAAAPVRFVPRFVTDPEIPALFRRADVIVLPYREIDQSGVLYTALAFGKPIVASAVGGFVEVAERHGAARLVPPGDAEALAAALVELLGDGAARRRLAAAAAAAAAGPYSWDAAAAGHLALYRELAGR
ncbi:MAG: glycosyltransferase family 4 protein [Thermoleophilaceae bacterium]|nr:glycosyltransferase family 4 protein [Thermoleophilaceae bacterium]